MSEEQYIDSDEIEEMPDEIAEMPEEIDEMTDEIEVDLLDVLEHIQQQLTFLEKKVDMLLSRSEGERQFDGPRPARKPFRNSYDGPRKSFDGPRKSFDGPRKPYNGQSQRFDRPPRRDRNEGEDRERGYREREPSGDNYYERRKPGKKPAGKPRTGPGKKPFYSRYRD